MELIGEFLALGNTAGSDSPNGNMEVVVLEPEFFKNLTLLLNATDDSSLGMDTEQFIYMRYQASGFFLIYFV